MQGEVQVRIGRGRCVGFLAPEAGGLGHRERSTLLLSEHGCLIQDKLGSRRRAQSSSSAALGWRPEPELMWGLPRRLALRGHCLLLAHVGHDQHVACATPSKARVAGQRGAGLGLWSQNRCCPPS